MRFFVDHQRRLVRTIGATDPTPPPRWVEVTATEYDQFRKETASYSAKALRLLRAQA
ncbi:hypothetical protein HOV23_gp077 [Pseudomonas phage Lana]|uniref:Uncharacterized protein n=1 Tax=Pseudomonas phage Lana TaxID=2530172 RepID=A0A481W5Y3_9CAUD|nr:hypothetical protein HOV23_gp077 [Pseudomonas phage Lana]QBJ04496.1 hypothetical protein [Pseudomonas phage Lana]